MPINHDKLFSLLEAHGHSSTYWVRQNGIHPRTVDKLKNGQAINNETTATLCALINCQPGDIMEYVLDRSETGKQLFILIKMLIGLNRIFVVVLVKDY